MKNRITSFFPSLTFSSPFFPSFSSLLLTSLTLLAVLSANAQVPSYVPTNGLVGYWPFNGNANDESGNGNNGTVNGATLTLDRFGVADKAYVFDGINDFIQTPYAGISGNSSRSLSLWFFTNNFGSEQVLLSYGLDNLPSNYFNIWTSATCTGIGLDISYSYKDYSSSVPMGQWNHYVVVLNSINGTTLNDVNIYQNGAQLTNLCSSANLSTQINTLLQYSMTFGRYHAQAIDFLNGSLDDIGIWNRALTADEVLALYNGCNVAPLAVSGNVTPTQFTQETYSYPNTVGSTYNWTVTNGVIVSGQGTNSIDVMWANTGIGQISVSETNATNCTGDVVTYDVVVIPTNVEELSSQLILYPNPATTELNLQVTSELIGTDVFVFDALGKQILKQQILSTNTIINTSSFAAGNYVLKVGGGVKKFEVVK